MKLFNKKEEKNKVGRPKLADYDTKKKAIISVCVALVLVITIALTGAFKLNIINFNKLKGTINCTEIPAELQPRSESNPTGKNEYGFTDLNFYSTVVSSLYNNSTDTTYCTSITEEQLAGLTDLSVSNLGNYYNTDVENVEGIQYLTGLTNLFIYEEGNVASVDLSHNDLLEDLTIYGSKLTEIDLTDKFKLKKINLNNNKLTSINLNSNSDLTELSLRGNDLKEIDLSNNHYISSLDLHNNPNLESINLSGNTALTDFQWIAEFGQSSKLKTLNLDGTTELQRININGSSLSTLNLDDKMKLITLVLENNKFENLDITNNSNLQSLRIIENLTSLDLKNNINLTSLEIGGINVNELDLTNNKKIRGFTLLGNTKITTLDASNNENISYINALENNNMVDDLNLSGLPALKNLDINNLAIKKLNLSGAKSLKYLNFSKKELEEINLSNTPITRIDFENNNLNKVNISNMLDLNFVSLENNNISELKMDNTPNVTYLNLTNNKLTNIDLSDKSKLNYLSIAYNNIESINVENNPLLSDLYISNNNITGKLDLSKNVNLLNFEATSNKIEEIFLPKSINSVSLADNNLSGKLDLKDYKNLFYLYLNNNELEEVVFDNNEVLEELLLNNNNFRKVDLSGLPNLNVITLQNNPMTNKIYMLKNSLLKYNDNIKFNQNKILVYGMNDSEIIAYENGKLKALKEGVTQVNMSNENLTAYDVEYIDKCFIDPLNNQEYCDNVMEDDIVLPHFLSQEVKVYDILSDVYKIDKDKKTIDASGLDLDTSKIKLTLEGLSAVVSGDNFIIKDGDTVVDTYKILNMKKVIDKPSSDNNDKTTTTKKPSANKGTNNKKNTTTNKKATTTEDLSDIEINGSFVSVLALGQVNGKDRNIVVKNDDITVTINGKDIEKIEGNLDLSYELKVLKESLIYNEVKDKVPSGMVLSFKGNNSLPGKVLISLDVTDIIKKNAGTRNLRLYSYKNGELTLVAKNINPKDKKLSFYVNELGSYVLTDKELEGKEIKEDKKLLESNNKINKGISFRCILWLILILIILGIIGYIIYKKRKNKSY